jgi:hypothetical protein
MTTSSSAEYVFRSEWRIAAGPDEVYAALQDVSTYPSWWPQVVGARWLDDDSGEVRCRSLLPYELCFVVHREIEDPDERVLRARLVGDLAGTSQWTVAPSGKGSLAVFDEEVDVHKRLVRVVGRFARPALRFNHDLMMRAGEKGLCKHLA